MSKKYEFWCRSCGCKFYLDKVNMSYCVKCDSKNPLELVATVDLVEYLEGMMGVVAPVQNRQLIDKRRHL